MPQKQTHRTKHTGRLKWSALFLATLALHMADTRADEAEYPTFSFAGFGTLSAVHSSERNADFTATFFQPNGAGATRRWSGDVDSRLGAQVTANFTSQLEGVLQVVSEQEWNSSYRPTIEWANLRYSFTPDFSVRAGRIILPAYMYSQSRKVGYATPWVRPPAGIYLRFPVTNADGVDLEGRFHIKGATNRTTLFYGNNRSKVPGGAAFPDGNRTESKNIRGVSHDVDFGRWAFHATYMTLRVDFLTTAEFLRESTPLVDEARKLTHSHFQFKTIAASYDSGDWFIIGEAKRSSSPFTGKIGAWVTTVGYRINDFTPFLGYASEKYLGGEFSLILPKSDKKVVTAGVRWDFMKNVDLKLQYDQLRLASNSQGLLVNPTSEYQPGGKVHVTSIALDFVF
jgi:hypothetical protein